MLVIFGNGSKIAEEVRKQLDPFGGKGAYGLERFQAAQMAEPPLDAERYLFTAGVLIGKPAHEMTNAEADSMMAVNFTMVVSACEAILAANNEARICIIGSESAYAGSFDRVYAGTKAALHNYVEQRRVGPAQQLVAVSPGIIEDAGMTVRRTDRENLEARRAAHPKKRFLQSAEVAEKVIELLYGSIFVCNTVLRMNGGEHAK